MTGRRLKLASFAVVGMACRQANDRPDQIGQQWQDFMTAGGIELIPNRIRDEMYALYTDYEDDHTKPFTMVIGCRVSEVQPLPAGLVARTVPAGSYLAFQASGPQPESLVAAWQRILSQPLARAYAVDFDRYRGPDDVEVYVGIWR